MFTIEELSQKIADYRNGLISFEHLENWFECSSHGAYADADVKQAYAAVDAAFSQYHFDRTGEEVLKEELANAILPFEYQLVFVFSKEPEAHALMRPALVGTRTIVIDDYSQPWRKPASATKPSRQYAASA